jgi:hypothetical protein
VAIEVCTSIARSTLARVLLNTHVMTIVNVMAVRVNRVMPRMPPPPEEEAQEGPTGDAAAGSLRLHGRRLRPARTPFAWARWTTAPSRRCPDVPFSLKPSRRPCDP